MPSPILTANCQVVEGNVPLLIERLCEMFLETNLPCAKDRLMPYVKQGIKELESQGELDIEPSFKLIGGIVWDALSRYMRGVRV
jgi:uncharacterized protein (UPF0261 family)